MAGSAQPSERWLARAVAEDAAQKAGALLRQRAGSIRHVRHKGLVDLVTDVDEESEAIVRATIRDVFPSHGVLGEEGGAGGGEDPRYRWIVDPLDGTTNYAHGFPFFCVSIAYEVDGLVDVGVIYDPVLDEMFVAERGRGATLNGQAIHVSGRTELIDCLLATGFPYDRSRLPPALRAFEAFSTQSGAVRRAGSAALDLAYVACGRLDGYWEYAVRPWDVAAGILLVEEAGGRITRTDGGRLLLEHEQVLSSNGRVHEAMLHILQEQENVTNT